MPPFLLRFLARHRGWVIFLFVVPLSFVYGRVEDLRAWFSRTFLAGSHRHDRKVEAIRQRVIEGAQSGRLMCTARKPWMTMSSRKATFKKDMFQIPIDLKHILAFAPERGILRVEPLVTMGDLTRFLVPKGYALAVHVEMEDLTIGGLCMGVGIETSSHRFGFLFETVEAFELITPDGKLRRASREEHPDLFHALPWSHGTLGFLVAVELKVIPVKPYMRLQYHPFHSQAAFLRKFRELAESPKPPAYLEALVFGPERAVIMTGETVEAALARKGTINSVNRWYKPWFYAHVASFLERGPGEEFIPVKHYFHRHTPSVFFQLKDLIPFADRPWYRWLFGWMGPPKVKLMKYSMTPLLRERAFRNRVAQDLLVPVQSMERFLDFIHPRYRIYPLWICPVRIFNHAPFEGLLRNPAGDSEMYVDIGIYGIPPAVGAGEWDGLATGRQTEALTRSQSGYHMLYADIFMTREEFECMFPHDHYRRMRRKYGAEQTLPEIYEKVIPEKWLIDLEDPGSEAYLQD